MSKLPVIDWLVVRNVGALTVLTRASYFTLIIVPILAGIWPLIRSTADGAEDSLDFAVGRVERIDGMLKEIQVKLEERFPEIELEADGPEFQGLSEEEVVGFDAKVISDGPSTPEIVVKESLENPAEVGDVVNDFESLQDGVVEVKEEIKRLKRLPLAFVWTYFGSLFVALGHLGYQVWCPDLVQRNSIDGYASQERQKQLEKSSVHRVNFARKLLLDEKVKGYVPSIPDIDRRPPDENHEEVEAWEVVIVEEAARIRILRAARESHVKCGVVFLLYCLGGVCLIITIQSQISSVIEQAF